MSLALMRGIHQWSWIPLTKGPKRGNSHWLIPWSTTYRKGTWFGQWPLPRNMYKLIQNWCRYPSNGNKPKLIKIYKYIYLEYVTIMIWLFKKCMHKHLDVYVTKLVNFWRLMYYSTRNFPTRIIRFLGIMLWGLLFQKQESKAGTCNYTPHYPWGVITSPCPSYLLLKHSLAKSKSDHLLPLY